MASLALGLNAIVVGVVASLAVDFATRYARGRVEALLALAAFGVGASGANLLWAVLGRPGRAPGRGCDAPTGPLVVSSNHPV